LEVLPQEQKEAAKFGAFDDIDGLQGESDSGGNDAVANLPGHLLQ
jgi:hypothetical protein